MTRGKEDVYGNADLGRPLIPIQRQLVMIHDRVHHLLRMLMASIAAEFLHVPVLMECSH